VGARRSSGVPEVPTFAEQGFSGFDLPLFVAAWAPAGTPPEITARLRESLVRAVADPLIRERMADQGQTPELSTAEELMAIVRRDTPRWGELIAVSGVRE
jgi:tripartite-type tricarboxylate transporter receptor subunit TctC